MSIEIRMPALSDTMESGSLASWLVKEGDSISSGDAIAEVETDKAVMEIESDSDGVLGKILVDEGTEDIPVGTLIAYLLEDGEEAANVITAAPKAAGSSPAPPAAIDEPHNIPVSAVAPAEPPPRPINGGGRVIASPLARRIAGQLGADLATVSGSGPNGRIVKRDLDSIESPAHIPYREVKLSKMRKIIAQRLSESKQSVPHFYLTIDVELDKLLAQRKGLKVPLGDQFISLSINDFIIRAVALALMKVPAANAQFAGDSIYEFERADISVAVAIDGGLVTPVIRGADEKGIAEIAADMRDLMSRAREGKLVPEDYQGGTFTISNLGMYGIREFSAIINPPQGAILAVGAGEQRTVVRDGNLAIATVMTCTLSCDHRVIDGAVGAEFLAAFKDLIEGPIKTLW